MQLRDTACLAVKKFPVERHEDVKYGLEQVWHSQTGCEYLAANPIFVPNLKPMLVSAVSNDKHFSVQSSAFEPRSRIREHSSTGDLFLKLSKEIIYDIVDHLGSVEIAALRLSSRAFEQLPIHLWHRLIVAEMPWLYEAWSLDPTPYYWATAIASDLKGKQEAEEEFRRKIEHEREVVRQDMPSVYEQWVNGEPQFEWPEPQERQEILDLSPIKLPHERTNWYQLYRNIAANWDNLKGLQNRERIWDDMMHIIEELKQIRGGNNPEERL